MALTSFHPAVSSWFERRFGAPTEPQARAWPEIHAGRHTLIAAPTGSGKTLAAFLAALDDLVRRGLDGGLEDATRVVYVSPLKALSNDIQKNLEEPLAGIRAELAALGLPDVEIRTAVRTGDTPLKARAAMIKKPPHILVTTPESLYILLTQRGRRGMLRTVRTVIVDEIHAVADDKRGSHLALSLERLEALAIPAATVRCPHRPVGHAEADRRGGALPGRVRERGGGWTAAVRHRRRRPRRRMDLGVEVPDSPLEAVMSNEVWEEIYDRLAELVGEHRTTLVFVNTRRLAERVGAHPGRAPGRGAGRRPPRQPLARAAPRRRAAAQDGRALALVATASLELGIDIGEVDLVCQIGSPRVDRRASCSGSAASGHLRRRHCPRDGCSRSPATSWSSARPCSTPSGAASSTGSSSRTSRSTCWRSRSWPTPRREDWHEDELFALVRRAWPYRDLDREDFDEVVDMLAEGFATRRGRRGAYLHHDRVNGRMRGRRGARLTAITSGGAIPDTADYQVVLEPRAHDVGTVNEDFAVESMAGDIFLLGNTSWRILRVEAGTRARGGRQGPAADHPVLARRGAGAHRRALRGRVAAAQSDVAARQLSGRAGLEASPWTG